MKGTKGKGNDCWWFKNCSVFWWKWSVNIHSSLTYSPLGTSFSQRWSCSVICPSCLKLTCTASHFSKTKQSCVSTRHQKTSGWDKRGCDKTMIWRVGDENGPCARPVSLSRFWECTEKLLAEGLGASLITTGSQRGPFHLSNPIK